MTVVGAYFTHLHSFYQHFSHNPKSGDVKQGSVGRAPTFHFFAHDGQSR